MPVNKTLASFSDFSFKVAFAVYVIGLIVMLAYYVRERMLQEAYEDASRREESQSGNQSVGQGASDKELVGASATKSGVASEASESGTSSHVDVGSVASASSAGSSRSGGSSRAASLWGRVAHDRPVMSQAELDARQDSVDRLGTFGQGVIFLGLLFHAACVILRGLSAHRFPWGNLYEYVALVSLVAMIVATVVLTKRENRIMWPWVLTPVVALLFYGGMKLYAASAPVVPALQSYWFPIHVSTVSIGAGFGLISGMCSLAYIVRMFQPVGQEHGFMGKIAGPLPSAKRLDRLAYRTAVVAFPIFGLGVIFGAIWAESAWGRFWNWDPKETMSFVTWILYAAYLHARATTGWKDQRAAWINVVAFGIMVFNLFFINLVVSGLHSYAGLN
ncbi:MULTISPECIES: c-type cytochrome biogenesis protein CcsB [Corynebacterium]|uniref:c-type cytochrome biogenesis protein CcsB n=1 Tax=Corynebacterium TaxID=1716 RepID=UPI00195A8E8A|nr:MULTISPECIES: c-type cytochrome biogenesis protein CcsB [Corynebacterium]MDN8624686.1 c-type cytochrome biogenesis protein CcsB [Corynebacterium kroppenstedtii]QRQ65694.1 c-type cytochrome biogenesis protein CcsB [Corynebacterium kroppenstedtii]